MFSSEGESSRSWAFMIVTHLKWLVIKTGLFLAALCKERLIRKDPDAEKDCRMEEKGTTEDEMVGWHH